MTPETPCPIKVFSYGTLQLDAVQQAIFGHRLSGKPDRLRKYSLSTLQISNPDVIATSGIAEHSVALYTGNDVDFVDGMVFDLSEDDLVLADAYEAADYKRIQIQLDSGTLAWLYIEK